MAGGTRERMIDAAIQGLQRHGLAGMSFTDVLASSGAARGAIYHHFPDGKKQLVAEAAARNGKDVLAYLATLPTTTPQEVVEAFLTQVRPVVAAASQGGGCAVAAVTVHVDGDGEDLCRVAATAFASWTAQLKASLTAAGLPAGQAGEVASLMITVLEGAQVVCRATGDLAPFDRAAKALARLLP
jgi:TetR/AcrR family transcriptional repressor of lmrAB and yxaGH operons